jgi:hypothetical protein
LKKTVNENIARANPVVYPVCALLAICPRAYFFAAAVVVVFASV